MTTHASEPSCRPATATSQASAPRVVFYLAVVLALSGCGISGGKKSDDKNPLILTECPATLPELTDPSLGATDKLMIQWANIFHRCRSAATAGVK